MRPTVRVALVQMTTPDDPAEGLAHVTPLIRRAAEGGAELILTPEATNMLVRDRDRRERLLAAEDDDVAVEGLKAFAKELGVWLLIGSAMVKSGHDDDPRAANRSLLIDPKGETVARYDKLHVFDVDLPTGESWRESAAVRPGDRAVVARPPWGGLGMTVCYDLRFGPLFHNIARAGADVIAVPAAFTVPTGEAHWEVLLRARAIETGCFILAPAQGGTHADGRKTWGRSTVVGPWGEVIAKLDHDRPDVLFADLDLSAVDRAREAIPQLSHGRAFIGAFPDL